MIKSSIAHTHTHRHTLFIPYIGPNEVDDGSTYPMHFYNWHTVVVKRDGSAQKTNPTGPMC